MPRSSTRWLPSGPRCRSGAKSVSNVAASAIPIVAAIPHMRPCPRLPRRVRCGEVVLTAQREKHAIDPAALPPGILPQAAFDRESGSFVDHTRAVVRLEVIRGDFAQAEIHEAVPDYGLDHVRAEPAIPKVAAADHE